MTATPASIPNPHQRAVLNAALHDTGTDTDTGFWHGAGRSKRRPKYESAVPPTTRPSGRPCRSADDLGCPTTPS